MVQLNWKRRLLYRWLDYKAKIGRGDYWISVIGSYVPIMRVEEAILVYMSATLALGGKSFLWYLKAGVYYLIYKVCWELFRYGMAMVDIKLNIWKVELDWGAKNKKYNADMVHEQIDLLNDIAEKVGSDKRIKKLDE